VSDLRPDAPVTQEEADDVAAEILHGRERERARRPALHDPEPATAARDQRPVGVDFRGASLAAAAECVALPFEPDLESARCVRRCGLCDRRTCERQRDASRERR
jgi:hypothetical protein